MLDEEHAAELRGATLVDGEANEVGEIEEIYTYADDDRPAVAAVTLEERTVLVPLADADIDAGRVSVDYPSDLIEAAPEPQGDVLTDDDFDAMAAHFGFDAQTLRDPDGHKGGLPEDDQQTSPNPEDAA